MKTQPTDTTIAPPAKAQAAPAPPGNVLGVSFEDIYTGHYRISLVMREWLVGGIPKDPDVQKKWLETQGWTPAEADEYVARTRKETEEAGGDWVEEAEMEGWSGFKSDATGGLFIETRQIKALIRECATELELTKDRQAGLRQRIQHGLMIKSVQGGERLYLGREKPDGDYTGVCHVMTPRGKKAAFKKADYVAGVSITFEVWIVQAAKFTDEKLRKVLFLAQEAGLGANRSQGQGKFDVTAFEVLATVAPKEKPA